MTTPRRETVGTTGSTNADLLAALAREPDSWPHLSSLRARHQTAGLGRAGREWSTPPDGALTASVVLRPRVPADRLHALTLVAGVACVRVLRRAGPGGAGLKWPNDLVVPAPGDPVDGWGELRKVGGILAQVAPGGADPAVVLGIGVNLTQGGDELPVPWAASLAGLGVSAPPAADDLWDGVLAELAAVLGVWEQADGDLAPLAQELAAVSTTLGRRVRVDTAEGAIVGAAVGLAEDGRLRIRLDGTGDEGRGEVLVAAGDVVHLRADAAPAPRGAVDH